MDRERADRTDLSSGAVAASAWSECISRCMLRGLEVVRPAKAEMVEADLVSVRFAGGRVWSIRSSPQCVRRRVIDHRRFIPVAIVQLSGTTRLAQGGRACLLEPGTFAYLNAADELVLDHLSPFEQLYVEFPDNAFPHEVFRQAVGITMRGEAPNDRPFFDCTQSVWAATSHLDASELRAALTGLVSLAQCTSAFRLAREDAHWPLRVKRALLFIEQHLDDPDLCPDRVAVSQGVSRRHLDELFRETGHRIRFWIWERRLQRAAEQLGATESQRQSLLQMSLELGFKSQSHFSRTFTKRFGQSPREYRRAHELS